MVFPAYAGMNRDGQSITDGSGSVPRLAGMNRRLWNGRKMRGDVPRLSGDESKSGINNAKRYGQDERYLIIVLTLV